MYHFVKFLFNPYTALVLGLGFSLLAARRQAGEWTPWTRRAFFCWACLFALSLRPVCYLLSGSLEWQHPQQVEPARQIDCIVVFGGGVIPPAVSGGQPVLTGSSLRRCGRAYDLYQSHGPCPILLCGGKAKRQNDVPSEAETMKLTLSVWGIPEKDIITEESSLNTAENAREAAKRIQSEGFTSPALVTHGRHLPRSIACLASEGVEVTPAGCAYETRQQNIRWFQWLFPAADNLSTAQAVFHEWVGRGYYWAAGITR